MRFGRQARTPRTYIRVAHRLAAVLVVTVAVPFVTPCTLAAQSPMRNAVTESQLLDMLSGGMTERRIAALLSGRCFEGALDLPQRERLSARGASETLIADLTQRQCVTARTGGLTPSRVTIPVGNTQLLQLEGGAGNWSATWLSTDSSVASVTQGLVRAVRSGTAVIVAVPRESDGAPMAAVVTVAGDASQPAPRASVQERGTNSRQPPPGRTSNSSAIGWQGADGYTVVLASKSSWEAAEQVVQQASAAGLYVGMLWSSDFEALLTPDHWVVFSGKFRDQAAAFAEQARLQRLGYSGINVRFISRPRRP